MKREISPATMLRLIVESLVLVAVLHCSGSRAAPQAATVKLATFRCDMTPPLEGRFFGGWGQPLTRLEDPLWAKGIVLDDGRNRYVVCAMDWCVLCNSAHLRFRRKLAAAAGTDASRVAMQCVHQHTAPAADDDTERLVRQATGARGHTDLEALDVLSDRLAAAVKESIAHLQPVDRLGLGQAKVQGVAATRRVRDKDGKIRVRWSSCEDPALRAEPEGYIDPVLKTVTLARSNTPLARLHYYATHPQTGGKEGWVGMDCVGHAREELERQEHVPQLYFTGCAGDVTMGKYNDGSPRARAEMAERLLAGMKASITATHFAPLGAIRWHVVPVVLPARSDGKYEPARNRATLASTKASLAARVGAAENLAYRERIAQPIELSMLAIGELRILHLPGEPMVEFQLFAQRSALRQFVAVAGYGDGGPGYLCTRESYAQGGYEPTASSVSPDGEEVLKSAIRRLLDAEQPD
jgi:hypothetical protein